MDKVAYQHEKQFVILNAAKIFLLMILISCSDKESQYIDGDDLIPSTPPFWEYFTVNGVDEDKDGVRDDFELLVNEEIDDENLRKALKQYARTRQGGITRSSTEEALKNVKEKTDASLCVNLFANTSEKAHRIIEIKSKYLNNWWRSHAYNEAARKYLPSGVYGPESSMTLDRLKACDFKVTGAKKILQEKYGDEINKNEVLKQQVDEYLESIGERNDL